MRLSRSAQLVSDFGHTERAYACSLLFDLRGDAVVRLAHRANERERRINVMSVMLLRHKANQVNLKNKIPFGMPR